MTTILNYILIPLLIFKKIFQMTIGIFVIWLIFQNIELNVYLVIPLFLGMLGWVFFDEAIAYEIEKSKVRG